MCYGYPDLTVHKNETTRHVFVMLSLLVVLGGFISINKSMLVPAYEARFLGLDFNTKDCTISVPLEKYEKAMKQVEEFFNPAIPDFYDVKLLERLRGKFCSWGLVVPAFQFYIREMNEVVRLSEELGNRFLKSSLFDFGSLKTEIELWTSLKHFELTRKWYQPGEELPFHEHTQGTCVLHTDSSGAQMGSVITEIDGHPIPEEKQHKLIYRFDSFQTNLPIHIKECLTIPRALHGHSNVVSGRHVFLKCDNVAVVTSYNRHGARDLKLNRGLLMIHHLCRRYKCNLSMEWISTKVSVSIIVLIIILI